MSAALKVRQARLPPDVNRILFVRNLPFNISAEEVRRVWIGGVATKALQGDPVSGQMYEIFGKYGAIRQVRVGTSKDSRGTAYVVYEDIYDARTAMEHLNGFNVQNRYLILVYFNPSKRRANANLKAQEDALKATQAKHGVDG
ncbi:hypothetical protein H632_c534p2, partial [Helicosporidium sp. ATCC 50920]